MGFELIIRNGGITPENVLNARSLDDFHLLRGTPDFSGTEESPPVYAGPETLNSPGIGGDFIFSEIFKQ